MTLLFIRAFFFLLTAFIGFYFGEIYSKPGFGIVVGCICGLALIILEMSLRRVSVRGLSSMVFGLLLGVFMAKIIADILSLLPLGDMTHATSRVIMTLIFSYLGAVMALRGKDEFHVIIPYVRFKRQDVDDRVTLLDTSAIIDGRIMDIYKTNFFSTRIVVPRFVLHELQKLADSQDAVKRGRGRRGMEMVRGMQKDSSMDIRIHEDDIPETKEVDQKLVRLAKLMEARICTTDYNLGRVATIQGVEILNLNDLASALKPTIYPGEQIEIRLVKEGKEGHQAVGFTDDGTIIVVNEARRLIGKKVTIIVDSILPTQAGRMIFAKLKNGS